MFKIRVAVSLAVFLSMLPAANANCQRGEEIDLRSVSADAFRNLPISDQGNFGICYAHAASTLIDYIRLTRKSDRSQYLTDPLSAAVLSTSKMEGMEVEGGEVCEVINGLTKAGFGCSASGVSLQQIKGFGENIHSSLVQKVFMPYLTKERNFEPVELKNKKVLSKEQKNYVQNMNEFLKLFSIELKMRNIHRNLLPSNEVLFEFFQNIYLRNSWASFDGDVSYLLLQGACERTKYSMPAMRCAKFKRNQSDLIGIVDSGLKKGLPTGAGICSRFLKDKKYKGVNTNGSTQSDCGEHAVVIIGKREQNGSCQYLIRNSWGSSAQYDWSTSDGDIWVNEFALRENFFEAQMVR